MIDVFSKKYTMLLIDLSNNSHLCIYQCYYNGSFPTSVYMPVHLDLDTQKNKYKCFVILHYNEIKNIMFIEAL